MHNINYLCIIVVFIGTGLAALTDISGLNICLVYTPDIQINQFIDEQLLPSFAQYPTAELHLFNGSVDWMDCNSNIKVLLVQDPRQKLINTYKSSTNGEDFPTFLVHQYLPENRYPLRQLLTSTGSINDALNAFKQFSFIGTVKHLEQFAADFNDYINLALTTPIYCTADQPVDEYEYNWEDVESFISELTHNDYIIYNRAMQLSGADEYSPVCNYDLSDYHNLKAYYAILHDMSERMRSGI